MLMADAQMNHAQKMANGEAEYQGKLLQVEIRIGKTSSFYYY
jgi:hypothetical protein